MESYHQIHESEECKGYLFLSYLIFNSEGTLKHACAVELQMDSTGTLVSTVFKKSYCHHKMLVILQHIDIRIPGTKNPCIQIHANAQ